jgi:hypothetical protein
VLLELRELKVLLEHKEHREQLEHKEHKEQLELKEHKEQAGLQDQAGLREPLEKHLQQLVGIGEQQFLLVLD